LLPSDEPFVEHHFLKLREMDGWIEVDVMA